MNVGAQLTNSILLIVAISKRLYSVVMLCKCSMILISLYMPHLIVIYRWHRPFRVYDTWPHRTRSISIRFILPIIFINSTFALADPPSFFPTRIDINLPNDLVTERVKLAVTWVEVWLHGMCGLISTQTLHRLACLLQNVIERRLLATTARAFQKWPVVSRIQICLSIVGTFLKIKISWGTWSPKISFMLWTCLLLGEQYILFRLLNITLILTRKLFLNDFLSLLFWNRKSVFLQVHIEIHLKCGSFLLLFVIIMHPKT